MKPQSNTEAFTEEHKASVIPLCVLCEPPWFKMGHCRISPVRAACLRIGGGAQGQFDEMLREVDALLPHGLNRFADGGQKPGAMEFAGRDMRAVAFRRLYESRRFLHDEAVASVRPLLMQRLGKPAYGARWLLRKLTNPFSGLAKRTTRSDQAA